MTSVKSKHLNILAPTCFSHLFMFIFCVNQLSIFTVPIVSLSLKRIIVCHISLLAILSYTFHYLVHIKYNNDRNLILKHFYGERWNNLQKIAIGTSMKAFCKVSTLFKLVLVFPCNIYWHLNTIVSKLCLIIFTRLNLGFSIFKRQNSNKNLSFWTVLCQNVHNSSDIPRLGNKIKISLFWRDCFANWVWNLEYYNPQSCKENLSWAPFWKLIGFYQKMSSEAHLTATTTRVISQGRHWVIIMFFTFLHFNHKPWKWFLT